MTVVDRRSVPAGSDDPDLAAALDQVVGRLHREFRGRYSRTLLVDLVGICRAELACSPAAALPELAERLARQRLRSGWASLLIDSQ